MTVDVDLRFRTVARRTLAHKNTSKKIHE